MQETKAINSKCFKKLDQQCEYLLLHFAIQSNQIKFFLRFANTVFVFKNVGLIIILTQNTKIFHFCTKMPPRVNS